MDKFLSFIKEHPWAVAIVIFAVGVLWLTLRGAGGGASSNYVTQVGQDPNAIAYGTQLQMAQIAAQQDTNKTNAAASVASKGYDTQLSIAQLQAGVTQNANTLSADVAKTIADYQAKTIQLQSTLDARTSQNQSNNQLEAIRVATAGQIQIAQAPWDVEMAKVAATRDVALASINSNYNANTTAIAGLQTALAANTANDALLKTTVTANSAADAALVKKVENVVGNLDYRYIATGQYTGTLAADNSNNAAVAKYYGAAQAYF